MEDSSIFYSLDGEMSNVLSRLELSGSEKTAPSMCSEEFFGFSESPLIKVGGVHYFERGGQSYMLCKSKYRVFASRSVLKCIGSKMTHTELVVLKATMQFLLGQVPVVPYVYFVPRAQLSFCYTRGQAKIHKLVTTLAARLVDPDYSQFDASELVPAPESFIDRYDSVDRDALISETLVASVDHSDRMRLSACMETMEFNLIKNGYYVTQDPLVAAFFPSPAFKFQQKRGAVRDSVPGVYVQRCSTHLMTPNKVSLEICSLVRRDGAASVLEAFAGYGSDTCFLQQLPVVLVANDADWCRTDCVIANTLVRGQRRAILTFSVGPFYLVLRDFVQYPLAGMESRLVYLDPPWSQLDYDSGGRPYDFTFMSGKLSSYLSSHRDISFIVKVPMFYDYNRIPNIRFPTSVVEFVKHRMVLLYYARAV